MSRVDELLEGTTIRRRDVGRVFGQYGFGKEGERCQWQPFLVVLTGAPDEAIGPVDHLVRIT